MLLTSFTSRGREENHPQEQDNQQLFYNILSKPRQVVGVK